VTLPTPPINRLGLVLATIGEELPEGISYKVGGADEIAKLGSPNRIVMEPRGRSYEGSRGGAGTLFTRVETVRAHIWGKSMAGVEELEELLINAIVKTVSWAVRPGDGEWLLEAVTTRGFVVLQDIQFLIPILRRQKTAPLTEFENLEPVIESPT
jgi:hypothetical protein